MRNLSWYLLNLWNDKKWRIIIVTITAGIIITVLLSLLLRPTSPPETATTTTQPPLVYTAVPAPTPDGIFVLSTEPVSTATAAALRKATPTVQASPTKQIHPTPVPTSTPKSAPTPTPMPVPPITLPYSNAYYASATATNTTVVTFIPNLVVTNFHIEADVVTQSYNGNGGESGIIFRNNGTTYYRFAFSPRSHYDFMTKTKTLASGTTSAIPVGTGYNNHVSIVVSGQHITIAINGTKIIDLTDSSASSGSVGVLANDQTGPTTTTCGITISAS